MDIDEALKRTSSHVVTDPATTGDDSSRTTPSTKDSESTHTHPGGVPFTPLSTEMGVDPPTLPPPTDSTGPVLTPPSTVPATGDTTLVTPSSLITLHVKLPKLSIKKFNRDLTKWVTFWDSFDSSIHSNLSLLNVDKFNYLNTFLESTTTESIAGFTLTSTNYEEAVATLKTRFGKTQLIVNKHMDVLLNLPAVLIMTS